MVERTTLEVFEVDSPVAEPFGVIELFLDQPVGGGVKGVVRSLHWTRKDAELAAVTPKGSA